jgi:Tol biopolymer transport system component
MLGLPNWSPDGSTIAFIESDANRSYVQLSSVDGAPIKTIPLVSAQQGGVRYVRNQAAIFNWTTCS